MRFDESKRLKNKKDFDNLFRRNKRYNLSGISFLVSRSDLPNARMGFSVSKKKINQANRRNAVKRKFKELFRQESRLATLNHDILVMPNSNLSDLSVKELKQTCEHAWAQFLKRFLK